MLQKAYYFSSINRWQSKFSKTTDVPFTSIYIDNNLYSANNSYCILPSHSILDKISFISITCPLDQTYCFRFCKPVNRWEKCHNWCSSWSSLCQEPTRTLIQKLKPNYLISCWFWNIKTKYYQSNIFQIFL